MRRSLKHATQTKGKSSRSAQALVFLNSTLTSTSHSSTSSLFFVVQLCVEVISLLSTDYTPNVYYQLIYANQKAFNSPTEKMTDKQYREDLLRAIRNWCHRLEEHRRKRLRCVNCNKRGHEKAQCPMLKNCTGRVGLSATPLSAVGTHKPETFDTKAEPVVDRS
ncbi:unnamed protein product [Clonostachys rosea f. rosea IK726]|uniref:Uncharacterized protein n=1 Tax=Clonostachys rosea f. rosea IK726 TaxID=1349383 RepID=A0ACA9TE35_BIOOC|nr:unnamed protein product [Clonostachys rosea f. rosea IK726]